MSIGLTPQQNRLLGFLVACEESRGVPPSFDEMRVHLRLRSKSGIARLLDQLEERGRIRRLLNRARAIEIVRGNASVRLPAELYRVVAASAARQGRSVDNLTVEALICWLDADRRSAASSSRHLSTSGENF